MPDLSRWTWFLASTFILLVTPGPSILYVVARGMAHGWRAAVFSAVGLALGDLLQVIATALGFSALLIAAPRLFVALKIAAGTYLVLLGASTLLAEAEHGRVTLPGTRRLGAISPGGFVAQGMLAWNPKTALFLLAFLPRFIAPDSGPAGVQILALGAAFVGFGLLTNSIFGCLGAKLGAMATRGTGLRTVVRFASGGVLIAVGIAAMVMPAPPTGTRPARTCKRSVPGHGRFDEHRGGPHPEVKVKIAPALLLLALLAPVTAAPQGHDHHAAPADRPGPEHDGRPGSVTGYIRDAACLLRNPEAGAPSDAEALECARQCVLGGSPLVVYTTDAALYFVVSRGIPDRSEGPRLLPYLGKVVKASGKVFERDGVHAIAIEEIEVVDGKAEGRKGGQP